LFSRETRARFDYIFTDSMTFTNAAGKRLRLWIPAEADIGTDVQGFMEELVATAVRIIETEPIDIYVNPTFLPAAIAAQYDELWTDTRMQRVIAAAVRHGVAIEINARYRLPSERFIRRAKAAGARFTIGTNNASAQDFGDWSYPWEIQRKVGLSWRDMWVPGRAPSRAQRELRP
jgi:histidinol phosphatase-like PHP family hydrolase